MHARQLCCIKHQMLRGLKLCRQVGRVGAWFWSPTRTNHARPMVARLIFGEPEVEAALDIIGDFKRTAAK